MTYQPIFVYLDNHGKEIFEQPLSPNFHSSVTPRSMIEVGPYHYLIVGQDLSSNGWIAHVWWQPGGTVQQAYYQLKGLPHVQAVTLTSDRKALVTALGKDTFWMAELDKNMTGVARSQSIASPLGNQTTLLDGFTLGTSDGKTVMVAMGNVADPNAGLVTTTTLARVISYASDWKTVAWDRPVSQSTEQRFLDGIALADGKIALVGFSDSDLIHQYADSRDPSGARTWLDIVDGNGRDSSLFELDKDCYGESGAFSAVAYNPVSKEIAVGVAAAYETSSPDAYFFDDNAVFKGQQSLSPGYGDGNQYYVDKFDLKSVMPLPGKEGFLFAALATSTQQVPNPDYGPYGDILNKPTTIDQPVLGQVVETVTR